MSPAEGEHQVFYSFLPSLKSNLQSPAKEHLRSIYVRGVPANQRSAVSQSFAIPLGCPTMPSHSSIDPAFAVPELSTPYKTSSSEASRADLLLNLWHLNEPDSPARFRIYGLWRVT